MLWVWGHLQELVNTRKLEKFLFIYYRGKGTTIPRKTYEETVLKPQIYHLFSAHP